MVECYDVMSCWENLHSEMAYWRAGHQNSKVARFIRSSLFSGFAIPMRSVNFQVHYISRQKLSEEIGLVKRSWR